MIVVTRTCDACKNEVLKKDQLWSVAIGIGCHPDAVNWHGVKHTAQWCRECMEARGLCWSTKRTDPLAPEPTATLESLIREIVQEELSE